MESSGFMSSRYTKLPLDSIFNLQEYVILDLETTGLDSITDEIMSMSCIRIKNGEINQIFHEHCLIEREVSPLIRKLTSLSKKDLDLSSTDIEVLYELLEFIGDSIVLIHNAGFDLNFISEVIIRNTDPNEEIEYPSIKYVDTLDLAREYINLNDIISYSLENIMYYLGLNFKAHNSLDDCKIIYNLVKYLKTLE